MQVLVFLLVLPFAVGWAALVLVWRLVVWLTFIGIVSEWLDGDG